VEIATLSRDEQPAKEHPSSLHRYGGFALAMSTMQPGLEHFSLPGIGSLAYHPALGPGHSALALGDPLCAAADRDTLLRAYLAAQPRSAFFQVSAETAHSLRQLGLHSTPMGYETWIELPHWHFAGQARKYLRNVNSRARRLGISLQEWPNYRERLPQLVEISDTWLRLRRHSGRELSFLARPLDSCHDPATRCFVAQRAGQPLAFVMFDPVHENGSVTGYAASLLRSRELGSAGWQDFIVLGAMEEFRREGLQWLTLGLSPFAEIAVPPELDSSPPTRWIFRIWRNYGNWLYNFRGVSFHKRFYPGEQRPAYFCSFSKLPLLDLRDALAAMGVSPLQRLNGYLQRYLQRLTG
jgi:phosphatidylglycerol lysyltransferase